VGIAGIAATAACGASAERAAGIGPGGAIKAGTKLSFARWGGPDVQDISRKHADQFQTKHPGVTVEFVSTTGQNHIDKLIAAATAGTPIDVFYLAPSDTPTLASRGLIRPIADYVKRDKYDIADFYPKCIEQYYWKDRLYALPRGFGNQDVYLNVDMWQGAGVKQPAYDWKSTSWSTNDFLDAAQRLARGPVDAREVWGWTQGIGFRQWAPWVWIFGGDVLNTDNTQCVLDQPPAVEGLQFLQDLIHKHKVMPPPAAKLNAINAMGSGQLGMGMGIPANLANFRKQAGLRFDVAPMPRKAARLTSGGGVAWHAAAGSADPAAAWELHKMVASTEFQLDECQADVTAPPRKSVLTSSCFNDPSQPPKGIEVMVQAPEFVHTDPRTLGWTDAEEEIQKALGALWDGTKTARQVVQELVPQVNRILKAANG
jgi:multiple sugar transport system substrate-binding protein